MIETRTYKRTKQVAAELGVSVQTLQRMVRLGHVPGVVRIGPHGRVLRFPPEVVEQLVRPAYDISQARQGS